MNEAKRLEAAVALCQAGGLPCNDLEADLAALSRAVVERGGPGAVAPKNWQADPTLGDDSEPPAYDEDPAGWIAWCERELARVTGQGQQPQQVRDSEGTDGDGFPTDAGSAPPGAAAKRKAQEARARAAAPAPRVAENGVVMPPPPPEGVKYGDRFLVPESPYKEFPRGPR
jgi:hypothetical protein